MRKWIERHGLVRLAWWLAGIAAVGALAYPAGWVRHQAERYGFGGPWAWLSAGAVFIGPLLVASTIVGLFLALQDDRRRRSLREADAQERAAQYAAEQQAVEAKRQAARQAGRLVEYQPPERPRARRWAQVWRYLLSFVRDPIIPDPAAKPLAREPWQCSAWGDNGPASELRRVNGDFTTRAPAPQRKRRRPNTKPSRVPA